nr:hypothetical protein [Chloroflexia bacterium]
FVELSNGLSTVLLRSSTMEAADATGCRDGFIKTFTESGAWPAMTPATGPDVRTLRGDGADRAFATLIEDATVEAPAVYYLECRTLPAAEGFLVVIAIVPANLYEQQTGPVDQLLATLQLPAQDAPAASAAGPITLPGVALGDLAPALVGVAGTTYTSPSYGFRLDVAAPWVIESATSDQGADALHVSDGTSQLVLDAYRATDITPAACLGEVGAELAADEAFGGVRIMQGADGAPLRGSDANGDYVVYTFTLAGAEGADDVEQVLYVACRTLGDGAMLRILHFTPPDDYDAQSRARQAFLAGLVLADATPPPADWRPPHR